MSDEPAMSKPPETTEDAQATAPSQRRATIGRTLVIGGAVALAVAALALPRWSPPPSADTAADPEHASPNQQAMATSTGQPLQLASISPPAAVPPRPAGAPGKKTLQAKPEKSDAAESASVAAAIATTAAAIEASHDDAAEPPDAEPANAPAEEAAATAPFPSVTITGCLETSGDDTAFRLTGTEGDAAPRSRSWRTAFLKKRRAPVALVEPPDQQALQTEVGKRVAVTGLLTGGSLKPNSFRVVAPSCNN